ncbi:MAG TPA: tetratricopeptide repeat protein [Blastocatellia bacterium]|nr:tetratricopeptide repeat protein [Blastocatellia bacterium]
MRFFASLAPLVILLAAPQAELAQSNRATIVDTKQAAVTAFEEGQNAQQRGDLHSAVRLYTNAVSFDPSLYQAYYQRATALAALGRDKEAEADLKKVNELEPKFARAHRALGQILLDRGQTDDAKRELARAIELEPKLPGVRVYYASALLKSGEPDRAIEHLKTAVEQREELPLAYALLGLAEERVGRTPDAFADYTRAIELDASNAIAHEGRARIFEGRGETAKAIEEYTAAFKAQPSRDAAIKLAGLHTRAGQAQAAIQIYRRLLLERPDDFAVRAEMACVMAENDQAEEAETEITRVLTARPNDAKLLARFGDLFYKSKPAVAVDYYKRAVDADPGDIRSRAQLGASLVRSLQIEAAVPVLNDVIARDPQNYPAHASLATALFKQKLYLEAAREFLWIIRSKPEVPVSYYFLAISLDHLGDCEQAYRSYQEFVRRADSAANKNEVEEANTRSAQLQRLMKEGKCKSAPKGKRK